MKPLVVFVETPPTSDFPTNPTSLPSSSFLLKFSLSRISPKFTDFPNIEYTYTENNQIKKMLPSKPRSGNIEFPQKNPSLGVSRSIPSSKYSKGNPSTPEINPKSFASIQRKPSKITNLPEKRIFRVSEMQQHMGQLEEELKMMKEKLGATEEERDRAINELRELRGVKKMDQVANMGFSEAMSTRKVTDIHTELNSTMISLSNTKRELKIKEKNIESLKLELGKAKELEVILVEKDASLDKLKEEVSKVKSSEAHVMGLLLESGKRILELEAEIEKGKESETKMFDSFVDQTEQLQQAKISLEESKLEIVSLRKKGEKLEGSSGQKFNDLNASQICLEDNHSSKEEFDSLKGELQLTKENLANALESEKLSSLKANSLLEEIELLKNELKLATEAEENDKKAMDDLALALKEVATEASQAKEKLNSTKKELVHTKGEAEHMKVKLKSTEDKYKALLEESRREADTYKNTAERLRLEAEESLLAWNGKETGFVGCIKRAEEEKSNAQRESQRLLESLKVAENMTKTAKVENQKLRDILKQALNEANVAKEAAEIARAENSQLKDSLAEKDNALNFLSQENENLRINEAASLENIKELKRLLSESSAKELKSEDKEQSRKLKPQNSMDRHHKEGKKLGKTFSFTLKDLKIPHKHKDADKTPQKHKDADEDHKIPNKHNDDDDSEKSDPLRGSIFDLADSPVLATHHQKKSSFVFTDDAETINSDDFDHLDATHFDDMENDRSAGKKKALLRRFGDIIRRRSFNRRDSSFQIS